MTDNPISSGKGAISVVRIVGALNLFLSIVGLGALAFQTWAFSLFPPEVVGEKGTSFPVAFRTMQWGALLLLIPLAYAGVQLLRLRVKAIALCNAIFIAEIVYIGALWVARPWIFTPSLALAVRSGLLNISFALQIITAYPVLALISLRIARRNP